MPSSLRLSPSMATHPLTVISLLLSTSAAMIQVTPPEKYFQPTIHRRGQTYVGCFKSSQPLSDKGTWQYQSTGYCSNVCTTANQPVLGLTLGNDCWCGEQLPAVDSQVDDSNCNVGCDGYGNVDCGGKGFWSVYLTGLQDNVPHYSGGGGSSSSSSSPPTKSPSSKPSTTTVSVVPTVVTSVSPGQTIIVTQSPSPAASSEGSHSSGGGGGKSNVAGIAAGVVVAVVAVAAIIGGVFFYLRRRQKKQAEEDYAKRSNQVSDFMRNGERKIPPGSSYTQMSDSQWSDQRLDPEAGRRNSVGSLADNRDYSRRILRVANPDSS